MKIEVLASGSKGNAYKVSDGKTTLLIECGIPYKQLQRILKFKVSDIDACLITHEHKDHSHAWKELNKFGVSVYMTSGTAEALGVEYRTVKTFKRFIGNPSMKTGMCKFDYQVEKIGSFLVRPFQVIHDASEPVGYLMESIETGESLVFITDTMYTPHTFKDVDYYMIECNYVQSILDDKGLDVHFRNRIRKSHMSLETVLEFLSKTDLTKTKAIYVMHLSDNNSDEELIKTEIQKATGKQVIIC